MTSARIWPEANAPVPVGTLSFSKTMICTNYPHFGQLTSLLPKPGRQTCPNIFVGIYSSFALWLVDVVKMIIPQAEDALRKKSSRRTS